MIVAALLAASIQGWTTLLNSQIPSCYTSYDGGKNLSARAPDVLPKANAVPQERKTAGGTVHVSLEEGYRILYDNEYGVPFINLKVERSTEGMYEQDQQHLLDHLKYLISSTDGLTSERLLAFDVEGTKVYGFSRSSLDNGSILSTLIAFPGDHTVVYFYFNNLKPEYSPHSTIKKFEKSRDRFVKEYLHSLEACR